MIKRNLRVFNVGTDWFFSEMERQGIEMMKVAWTPPPEIPEDIKSILGLLGKGE